MSQKQEHLEQADGASKTGAFRQRLLKAAFLLVGIGLLVYLINAAGPAQVLDSLRRAGPYLPILLVFDIGWFAIEAWAHRVVLGDDGKKIPLVFFIRTVFISYAFLVLMPLGRAGAEVSKIVNFKKYISTGSATAAATNMQGVSLLANCVTSLCCGAASGALLGWGHVLTMLIFGNGILVAVLGSAVLLISRGSRIGQRLSNWFPKFAGSSQDFDSALRVPRSRLLKSCALCVLARMSQTTQYGLMLLAVGGSLTFLTAFLAQGVHLVGAGLGDFVPNQMGVHEFAFNYSAAALNLEKADALAIPLLARASQLVLATGAMATMTFWRDRSQAAAVRD